MSKGFLALDGLLVVASIFFVTQIWHSILAPSPIAGARSRPPAASAALARGPAPPAGARAPLASYGVIGAKSLFSPARTEGEAATGAAPSGPRPFIYVVVLLSAFGKAKWFLLAAAVGAPVYLLLALWLNGRHGRVR